VDRSINQPIPDEAAIREILKKIGKPTEDQELNCGACGYPSCRDKAIAVYQGKAELYMCLPYMRERAESLANVILKATPNIIIAVNGDMEIQEFNDAAERMFQISRETAIGRKLYQLIDTSDFERVWETHESIFGKKVEYKEYGVVTEQDIMYVEDQQLVMAIMRDITNEERQARQMYKIKAETVEMAQKVIDKQMMVVQQIASLLGETTAETKVTLTRLKDMILYDREDGR
jgi:PAS domain S-box-containing protein